MKKGLLFLFCLILFFCTGCKERYQVDYVGSKGCFVNAKDSYTVGTEVSLVFDCLATDTDYTFYVDGKSVSPDWENEGYTIEFTMPDHDVVVDYSERNSMEYVPWLDLDTDDGAEIKENAVSASAIDYYGSTLVIVISNRTGEDIYYGEYYELQKKEGEEYVPLPCEEWSFIAVAYLLEDGQDVEVECDLSIYDELDEGEYRLVKSDEIYADFTLIYR